MFYKDINMHSLNIRIPDKLNDQLIILANSLKVSKSHIVRKAIKSYLLELHEDIEDYTDAIRISAMNNPSHSLGEVLKGKRDKI